MTNKNLTKSNQSGVALMLVIFIITLASILVVSLTYSTFLGARLNANVEKSLQAEYLLKSSVNVARVLVGAQNKQSDSFKDDWGYFKDGAVVPAGILGLDENNIKIELEIRPEGSKLNLNNLHGIANGGSTAQDLKWRLAITELFKNLGFDEDEEVDQTGLFAGKVFKSEDLVANLIDYIDPDDKPYMDGTYRGIEDGSKNLNFPPQGGYIQRISELSMIPGFTPGRMQLLMPLVTVYGGGYGLKQVNVNVAPEIVLQSLSNEITPEEVSDIISFRDGENGPFTQSNLTTTLQDFVADKMGYMVKAQDSDFQIIAKVDFGTFQYFIRAYLTKNSTNNKIAEIASMELFY